MKPIRIFVEEELKGCERIVDPFAREARVAHITNDLNTDFDTDFNMDALAFLKTFEDQSVDGVLFDPPYSLRQLKECYEGLKMPQAMTQHESRRFYSDIKDEIARITMPGAKVLYFGWDSGGISKARGFKITRILLVPHGGPHHDTICVSDTKLGREWFV